MNIRVPILQKLIFNSFLTASQLMLSLSGALQALSLKPALCSVSLLPVAQDHLYRLRFRVKWFKVIGSKV